MLSGREIREILYIKHLTNFHQSSITVPIEWQWRCRDILFLRAFLFFMFYIAYHKENLLKNYKKFCILYL